MPHAGYADRVQEMHQGDPRADRPHRTFALIDVRKELRLCGLRVNATLVTVETDIGKGVNFFMVGLPDSAVKRAIAGEHGR